MLNTNRLLVVSVLYLLCFLLAYPLYQYTFDVDGIGYLMVAKRLSAGDYERAVNGYWSPLHSWIIAPFFKLGINGFIAFKVSNGLIGLGILINIARLLNKTRVGETLQTIALLISIPLIISYAFHDLAADILFCFLILVYINIITSKDFFESRNKNIACGIIGCLCFFAKTYGFLFFPAHFLLTQYLLYRASNHSNRKKLFTRNISGGLITFLLLASPWLYILSNKYKKLTFGYSGELNFKWQLLNRVEYAGSLLKAPPYPDSPFGWEDPLCYPYTYEKASLFTLLVRETRLALTNFMTALEQLNTLSFLSIAIIAGLSVYLLKKQSNLLSLILLTILLMPAGYILIHIEARFLWAIAILLLVSGTMLVQYALEILHPGKYFKGLCWGLFFISFLVYPVNWLKDAAGRDKDLFLLARDWKEKGITGRYATTANGNYGLLQRAAYLTDSQLYIPTRESDNYQDLQEALHEHSINYFFFFYRYRTDLDAFMQTPLYKSATVAFDNAGIVILKMR